MTDEANPVDLMAREHLRTYLDTVLGNVDMPVDVRDRTVEAILDAGQAQVEHTERIVDDHGQRVTARVARAVLTIRHPHPSRIDRVSEVTR